MTATTAAKTRAFGQRSAGDPGGFKLLEIEPVAPGPTELRVRVRGSALNPADLRVSQGDFFGRLLHAQVSPLVVGYDFSGDVETCGTGVDDLRPGDEVFGFLPYWGSTRQGAFAESVTVARDTVAKKPAAVSHEVAAAAATPACTALQSLRDRARLKQGGRVLLIGAAGGVGSLAIGIAKRLGARVTAVCSTHAVDYVRELGADEVIDRRKQDPLTATGPFDVIFDAAAAHSFAACRHLLTPDGTYVNTLPGPGLIVGKVMTLFSSQRCDFIAVKSVSKDLELIASWIVDGMRVPIDSRFPVRDVRLALDRLSKSEVRGRLAIQVDAGF